MAWREQIAKRPLGHWSEGDCQYALDEIDRLAGEVERRTDVLNDAIRWLSTYRPVGGRYTVKELEDFDARLDALKVRRSSGEPPTEDEL